MQIFNNINTFYVLPTIAFCYETKFDRPWEFHYFFIDILWLKWGLEITIKKEKYA